MNKLLALLMIVFACSPLWAKEVFTGEVLNAPFTIHGRLSNYNGSANMRIWIIGSKRMLYAAGESPALERINQFFGDGGGWFSCDIYGDFTVEPLVPDTKGSMRPVRILEVKNLVITREGKVVSKRKTL
ncbi:hypothetical protein [Pedosphaera parvula]|uniref:Uncharacterized protein n=1 Tax=Pedosphaera parvula (strain Ellin514) TaxID=320771 RepID=B9XGV3_PEDPL|nr:hypothetical protein [Pedosphaera parvula]EEF60874.1 conserved hypothetical protein [Pedosphaera parvula Ellin514]